MTSSTPAPRPGWYAQLDGEDFDLEDWRHSLNEPFDPVAEQLPDGKTVLRSSDFDDLDDASEVRERALVLIARMNGAIGLWNSARPVRFGGVIRIDEQGRQHAWVFGEMAAVEMGRCIMRATAVLLGPDGKPLPPPPPQPSQPQAWNRLAEQNDDISDLLDHFGRADNWYDIYKTIEVAAHLVDGKHRLWKIAQPETKACRNLDQNANFYRHARGVKRPDQPLSVSEAKPLLAWLVRAVLERQTT